MRSITHFLAFILCFSTVLLSCSKSTSTKNPIEQVLNSEHLSIKKVVENINQHGLQILFTKVEKDKNDNVTFEDYNFQVDDTSYFYPASSVKFPVAILALEKLNDISVLNRNTPFKLPKDSIFTTFEKEIEKLFAVSDNEAYNRLFEFLGQDDINKRLNSKSIIGRISHRLSTDNADRLATDSIYFYSNDTIINVLSPIQNSTIQPVELKGIKKGKGYFKNESLVNEPMDFSKKNYLPVTSLHECLKRLVYPELFSEKEQFKISEDDRQFILKSMSQLPKEAGYDKEEYYDSYVKFLVFGDSKKDIPEHIKIYNKVGYAYGTLTDCAHIINTKTNIEYFITATILVNSNEIFNDDTYEYESIGIPFLAELGRQLIQY